MEWLCDACTAGGPQQAAAAGTPCITTTPAIVEAYAAALPATLAAFNAEVAEEQEGEDWAMALPRDRQKRLQEIEQKRRDLQTQAREWQRRLRALPK